MQTKPETRQELWVCALLLLAVLAVFGQTAHFGFVNYDDDLNVYENPVVAQGLSARAIVWAFTHAQVFNWIPLTTISHELDCQLFGMQAGRHHFVSVLWHVANAALLFMVMRRMTGRLWCSAFVAAVFAIHPLRAESVAWVSERKDVLSGFFFLLAIWAYVRQVRRPSRAVELALFLCFALGLLAKSMVATLPFVLLLLDYWPLGRLRGWRDFSTLVVEKIPLFALSAAACVAAARVPGLVVSATDRTPLLLRLGNSLVSYTVYLRQFIFPVGLAIPYPNTPRGPAVWEVCTAIGFLGVITTAVVMCRKKSPYLLVGWLWYLGMMLPVIGLVQISRDIAHADRYTYLPGIGLAIMAAWAATDLSAGWRLQGQVLFGLAALAIGALIVCARLQTSYWRDNRSLWAHTLVCDPANIVARLNLCADLVQQGDLQEGIRQYRMALDINPEEPHARYGLASALFREGNLEEAVEQYRKALQIIPDFPEALLNLGVPLAKKGQVAEAIVEYQQALKIEPRFSDAHNDLGAALFSQGDNDGAIAQYRQSLEIRPDYPEALNNLGHALFAKGDVAEAISQYRKALEIRPGFARAHCNLAAALVKYGKLEEALTHYRQALELDPADVESRAGLNIAVLLQKRDQGH